MVYSNANKPTVLVFIFYTKHIWLKFWRKISFFCFVKAEKAVFSGFHLIIMVSSAEESILPRVCDFWSNINSCTELSCFFLRIKVLYRSSWGLNKCRLQGLERFLLYLQCFFGWSLYVKWILILYPRDWLSLIQSQWLTEKLNDLYQSILKSFFI